MTSRRVRLAAAAIALSMTGAPARGGAPSFHEIGASLAAPTGAVATASYAPTLSLLGDRLRVGVGPRFSAYLDEGHVEYPNGAAALLAAGAHHVLTVRRPRTYALNLMFVASARVIAGLEVGVNIDLVGVGFGPGVTGTYSGADPAFSGAQSARPSTLNLLLFGPHDHGQLDSELFLAYWFGRFGIRAGVSHMSTEFTTSRPLDAGNDRFRASATRFFVATGFRLR